VENQETGRQFEIDVCEDVVVRPAPPEWDSPSEYTERVYFVTARAVESQRFWPDYVHEYTFENRNSSREHPRDRAEKLVRRILAAWGENGTIPESRFVENEHWEKNTRLDPMQELALHGAEDEYNAARRDGWA